VTCPHATDVCLISTKLAGKPVPLADDACRACNLSSTPREVNAVTLSKAIYIAGPLPHLIQQLTEIQHPYIFAGVGTELAKLISWFPIPKSACRTCKSLERRLNKWGPEVCVRKRAYILKKLHVAARRRSLPFSERLVGILVDRAIKNATNLVSSSNNSSKT